jgi:hypothetical protein
MDAGTVVGVDVRLVRFRHGPGGVSTLAALSAA